MILRRRHKADRHEEKVNPKLLELQAALEILAEIFRAGPATFCLGE